jgi:hypothetical protein
MTSFVRLMVVKQRTGWGYETLVREVSDSLHLRRFCLLALTERVPVELGDHELVAGAAGGQRLTQSGPGAAGAGQAVIDVDPVGGDPERGKGVALGGEGLGRRWRRGRSRSAARHPAAPLGLVTW